MHQSRTDVTYDKGRILRAILYAWLVFQLFEQREFGMMWRMGVDFTPARLLFCVIGLIFFYQAFVSRNYKLKLEKIEWLMILFTGLSFISLIIAGSDVGEENYGTTTRILNFTLFPFLGYVVSKSVFNKKENIINLCWFFFIIGIYLGFTGIAEHYRLRQFVWPSYIMDYGVGTHFGRTRGPFVHSVAMGKILSASAVVGMMVMSFSKGIKKITINIMTVIIMSSLYFTYTRGPWVGFGLSLCVIAIHRSKIRKTVFLFMVIIFFFLLMGIGSKLTFDSESNLFSKRQNTVDDRIVTWMTSWEMIKDKPIFGIGFGQFNIKWYDYYKVLDGYEEFKFDGNHNLYLGLAAEVGIFATSMFIMIPLLFLKSAVSLYKRLKKANDYEKGFIIISVAILLAHMFTSFFSDPRHEPFQNTIVFVLFGAISGIYNYTQKEIGKFEN